jgi:hypothetical protein
MIEPDPVTTVEIEPSARPCDWYPRSWLLPKETAHQYDQSHDEESQEFW